MTTAFNPLKEPAPSEVPLVNAPLIRVIGQIRFPLVMSIAKQDFIATFQEEIRKNFPILRSESIHNIVLGSLGGEQPKQEIVWRFFDAEEKWRVSLSPSFVAIETHAYESRKDFLGRFNEILEALQKHISPQRVERVGLRYVDRVSGEDFSKLSTFIRDEMLGILSHDLSQSASHSISETLFHIPEQEASLLTRWGRFPRNSTIDPGLVPPINEESWILDLDMFSNAQRAFDVEELIDLLGCFAERTYSFFRWVVTDEFLKNYGGEL